MQGIEKVTVSAYAKRYNKYPQFFFTWFIPI